ncbi:hypothetical protein SERLA73DRAFT_174064 [Serpula lacrymans var. lacrymans S7.3]|uniref:t-SNARE coiled-coil homology domain-containing protein n=2 Tax=Serpula lacrymans var. lacrymans TaxID=341189 RepID=F8PHN0_SERL3|nr:uncharacterized protein SERLADRAFT_455090 [Serpula lacrymans var. lacrymans S7.9]EGO05027.1 hypothetical protein SERLA73DRAFT_174064 [Serpula lacrymans var. lacrymans S7.3]EGO30805.1 hypothetical protein SERLADRAFT_455090 [Serpula lacrymans var. lacrymans S7.9]
MSQRVSNVLRDRSSILGLNSSSGLSNSLPLDHSILPQPNRFFDDLEGQNDTHMDTLHVKLRQLKDLTVGIRNEVRSSTAQFGQMNDAFSETSGILAGSFRRMNNMSQRQGCHWVGYIIFMTIVFWFFVLVWWLRS